MIRTYIRFMNRHSLTLTQITNNLADTGLVSAIYNLATIFGCENDMITTIPPLCQVLDTYFFQISNPFSTSILTATPDFSKDY